MAWWLFALVVAVVLGTLGLPLDTLTGAKALIDGAWSDFLMNTLVVGCIFLCHQCWQMAYVSQRWSKAIASLVGLLLIMAVGFLFLLKTLGTWYEHEKFVPKTNYTISATVHIQEISDAIYDPVMGTHYRQKAVLSNLKLVDNLHKYKDNAKTTTNPFGVDDTPQNVSLPDTMSVLLMAFSDPKKDLQALQHAKPNTKATMTLTISPVKADKKADGFDGYRWLRTRHIHANAKIHSIDGAFVADNQAGIKTTLETWRWQLRAHFYQNWHALSPQSRQNKAITLSLLTGDRALIDKDTKALYQLGGISHLLAISGTHVVFLALMLASVFLWLTNHRPQLYEKISRATLKLVVMIGASLLYALFTGFDVPAVRTVYMLMALALVRLLALPMSSGSVLCWVALVMIWLDPFVLWQAGFWLSFVAVWLLMRYDETSSGQDLKEKALNLLKLQVWLFVAMLPVSLWLFGKVSLWGLIINLFAVGLFSAVIVPINLLAGVLFVVLPALSDVLWALAGGILGVLHVLLGLIDGTSSSWIYESMGALGLCLMGAVLLPFVLPIISKKYAIVPMVALSFLWVSEPHQDGLSVVSLELDNTSSQLLITQANADPSATSSRATWLVLADVEGRLTPQKADALAKSLTDSLKKHRVNHLTGVVVQTSSPILHEVVQKLSKNIVLYRYWHAGKTLPSVMPVLSCQAGELWRGEGLAVKALTGWQDIDDKAVWGCTLVFDGAGMINGTAFGDASRLVINGATDDKAWQLYDMLCHTPQLAPSATDVWLNHPKAVVLDETLSKFSPKHVISDPKDLP